MKKHGALLALSLMAYATIHASVVNAATTTHRYQFGGNVNDSVGSINATATANNTYTEALTYVTDTPNGATGPTQSLRVGLTDGKKSGFSITNNSINLTSGSISLWIKPTQGANAGDDYILNMSNPWSNGIGIYVPANTASLGAVVANNSYTKASAIAADQWTYVCITWNFDSATSAGTMSFYVNGDLAGTRSYTNLTSTAGLSFGGYNLGNTTGNMENQFRGLLYDLQIYNGALTTEEVKLLYSSPGQTIPVPEPAGLTLTGMGFLCLIRRNHH